MNYEQCEESAWHLIMQYDLRVITPFVLPLDKSLDNIMLSVFSRKAAEHAKIILFF